MFEWFEVRSPVFLKIQVLWDVTPCQLVNGYRLESPKKWLWRCCGLTDMWKYFVYWYLLSESQFHAVNHNGMFVFSFIFLTENSLITKHIGYSILDIKQNSVMENCRIKSSISDHTLWENYTYSECQNRQTVWLSYRVTHFPTMGSCDFDVYQVEIFIPQSGLCRLSVDP